MRKALLLAGMAAMTVACKTEKKEATEEVAAKVETTMENEWQVLFDGTNFDHWRGYGSKEMHSEWTIDDGAMLFTPGEKGGKNIITKDSYTNFVLSLEWKISEAGNSGIFWGVHESPEFNEAYETGPEIQVLDDANTLMLIEEERRIVQVLYTI